MHPKVLKSHEYHALLSPHLFLLSGSDNTHRQRAINDFQHQICLTAVLFFPSWRIRMKLVVAPSAQRYHEHVMRFCSHAAQPISSDVVRIISLRSEEHTSELQSHS